MGSRIGPRTGHAVRVGSRTGRWRDSFPHLFIRPRGKKGGLPDWWRWPGQRASSFRFSQASAMPGQTVIPDAAFRETVKLPLDEKSRLGGLA